MSFFLNELRQSRCWPVILRHLRSEARFVLISFGLKQHVVIEKDGRLHHTREAILQAMASYITLPEARRLLNSHEQVLASMYIGEDTLIDAYYKKFTPSLN